MRLKTRGPVALAGFFLGAAVATCSESPAKADRGAPVLAQAGEVTVTEAQLQDKIGNQLFALKTQEYQLKEAAVLDLVGDALLEREAKTRGIAVDELVRQEIEAKAEVTDADRDDAYQSVRARAGNRPEAEVKAQLEPQIRQQKLQQRRAEYLGQLRAKAGFRLFLDPPRVPVTDGNNPFKGPADAAVTIVEFSDFQCPYCSRVNPTLQKVMDTYKGKVRIVFRDFPLLQIHPQAAKAAEAGACANDQGKFWELHDRMFENQTKLQVSDLKQYAVALGLNSQSFDECLDSGRYAGEWESDMNEGSKFGVTGTPAFFINGRLLSGAQPFENFSRVIDDELARAQPAPSSN